MMTPEQITTFALAEARQGLERAEHAQETLQAVLSMARQLAQDVHTVAGIATLTPLCAADEAIVAAAAMRARELLLLIEQ